VKTGELFGKEVLDANANKMGKVTDMEFELEEGTIQRIIVKSGLKTYHINIDKIDKIGDKILLSIDKDTPGAR
jgi:sporulation protein YlmC with PRC-barrel domain